MFHIVYRRFFSMFTKIPKRCIDPIIKFCQECPWGWVHYPEWVETSDDLTNCTFECGCTLGFDKGRPEDEPTKEELDEFEKWWVSVHGKL